MKKLIDIIFIVYICIPGLYAQDEWGSFAPLNAARSGAAAAVLDGEIYVIGGLTNNDIFLTTVEKMNPVSGIWQSGVVAETLVPRVNATAIDYQGKIYLIGGRAGSSVRSEVEVYDPAANNWSLAGSLNDAREGHSTVIVNNKICVFGGVREDGAYPLSIEIYNEVSDEWFLSDSTIAKPRALAFSDVRNDTVYMFGGVNAFPRANGYRATVDTSWGFSWTEIGGLQSSRGYGASAMLANGRMFMMGGYTLSDTTDRVEVFHSVSGQVGSNNNLPSARLGMVTAVVNDTIYLIGGSDAGTNQPLNLVEVSPYSPVGLDNESPSLPGEFLLLKGYPNPFNGVIQFNFHLPKTAQTMLNIYDIRGKKVATLLDEFLPAGQHLRQWNAETIDRKLIPSGLFIAVLTAGNLSHRLKIVYVK